MAKITVNDLLEAGVHFGHQTKRWNPKMKEYVYGVKNGIYIIDLAKTMHQLADACNFLQHTVADGGEILFVGTKRQAQNVIKEAAETTGMYYVTERWLGGTLTNNATIKRSVDKMREIDRLLESDAAKGMRKKELSSLMRQSAKLHRNLGGIWNMEDLPAALVIVDVCQEHIAVAEARKLKIPIVAIIDTNANPDNIAYPIVANDDAFKSIAVIMNVITSAVKTAADLYQKKVVEEKAAAEKAKKEAAEAKKAKEKAEKAEKADKKPAAKAPAKKAAPKKEKKADESGKEEKKAVKKAPAKKAAPKKETAAAEKKAEKSEPEKKEAKKSEKEEK